MSGSTQLTCLSLPAVLTTKTDSMVFQESNIFIMCSFFQRRTWLLYVCTLAEQASLIFQWINLMSPHFIVGLSINRSYCGCKTTSLDPCVALAHLLDVFFAAHWENPVCGHILYIGSATILTWCSMKSTCEEEHVLQRFVSPGIHMLQSTTSLLACMVIS